MWGKVAQKKYRKQHKNLFYKLKNDMKSDSEVPR